MRKITILQADVISELNKLVEAFEHEIISVVYYISDCCEALIEYK